MNIGTGLQNKLLEAMAMKMPCVTSKLANGALGAEDGNQVMIAHSPQEYAECILQLLEYKDKADNLAQNGYDYVLNKYTWDTYCTELQLLLNSVVNKVNNNR